MWTYGCSFICFSGHTSVTVTASIGSLVVGVDGQFHARVHEQRRRSYHSIRSIKELEIYRILTRKSHEGDTRSEIESERRSKRTFKFKFEKSC